MSCTVPLPIVVAIAVTCRAPTTTGTLAGLESGHHWGVSARTPGWPTGATVLTSIGIINVSLGDDDVLRVRLLRDGRIDDVSSRSLPPDSYSFLSDPLEASGAIFVAVSGGGHGELFSIDTTVRSVTSVWKGDCGDWPHLESAGRPGDIVVFSDIGADVVRVDGGETVKSYRHPSQGGCVGLGWVAVVDNRDVVISSLDGSAQRARVSIGGPPRSLVCEDDGISVLVGNEAESWIRNYPFTGGETWTDELPMPAGARWRLARVGRAVIAWSPAEPLIYVRRAHEWRPIVAPGNRTPRNCSTQTDRSNGETVCVTADGYFTLRVGGGRP